MHQSPLLFLAMLCLFASVSGGQTTTLTAPAGWLTTGSGVVKSGSHTRLNWEITYPSTVKNYVTIVPPGTVQAKEKLKMEIRALGAGVTESNSLGQLLGFVKTEAYFSYNNGSFSKIFTGTNLNVNPSTVLHSGTVEVGKPLKFGARYYYNGSWSTFYYSNMGNNNVRVLVNGDTPPTAYPLHTAPALEDFLRPYLDGQGRIKIGPMDVIVVMELTHTDAQYNQQGYDLQDMVLLVTFKTL